MTDYLSSVQHTERFLCDNQVKTSHGITWNRVPDGKPTHSFYHGSAGVLTFYLELYSFSADDQHLEIASQAGEELVHYINEKATAEEFITIGIYSGWPSYVYVLNELYKATKQEKFKRGALTALSRMTAQAANIGKGIGWIEPVPFSDITGITGEREVIDLSVGAAGAGIIYLYAHRQGLSDDALPLAIKTADRLLEVAQQTPDGLRWLMMTDMPFPFTAPNFAHGGAGVGYFLADLYRETNNEAYLQAAVSAAEYVKTRVHEQSKGFLVCHTEEQQPASTFYLGVCHGPAGTGRFMHLLHKITEDDRWQRWLIDNFEGLVSTGAPEERSKGLWNNYGQCCGDAGIGDYALYLYDETKDERYLAFANRIAKHLVSAEHSSASADQSISWAQAEHRSRPDFTERQTGYMQGAAGIGSFLLHLHSVIQGTPCKLAMPDSPFSYG